MRVTLSASMPTAKPQQLDKLKYSTLLKNHLDDTPFPVILYFQLHKAVKRRVGGKESQREPRVVKRGTGRPSEDGL